MSEFVAQDCKLYVGGYNFSSSANTMSMEYTVEIKDATAFGDDTRVKAAGLLSMTGSIEGYFEAGVDKVDPVLYDSVGVIDTLFSMCPNTGADGEVCYSVNGVTGTYNPIGGTVGDMLKFTAAFEGSGGELVQGTVLKNGTVGTTGSGTAYQIGAILATEKAYAFLHVTAVSGSTPTIVVEIESDDNSGFVSAVSQHTFTLANAIGSEVMVPLSGAITDDYWRAIWTVTGGTPSFDIVVSFGIK